MIRVQLEKKRKGFSGITHVLLAITLFLVVLLFPVSIVSDFISLALSNTLYFLIFLFILSGASLLPDLDNDESTAGYHLGIIGSIIKTFMKTTAFVVYSLYNLPNDRPPKSMHRLLWHTPFVAILILIYFIYFTPQGDISYWSVLVGAFKNKDFADLFINHTSTTLTIILAYICGKLGSNILLYWVLKLLPIKRYIKSLISSIIPLIILFYLLVIPISQLKYIGIAIGLGYLFHIIGDLISQGSVPVHWPIPYKKQAWHNPWILGPFQIRTGGIVNTILNFILLGLNIVLLMKIFG